MLHFYSIWIHPIISIKKAKVPGTKSFKLVINDKISCHYSEHHAYNIHNIMCVAFVSVVVIDELFSVFICLWDHGNFLFVLAHERVTLE